MTQTRFSEAEIQHAIERGTRRYFDHCRETLPDFIDRHFRYPGAIQTNRVALGWDMLRAPVNLFWAPLYALVSILRFVLGRIVGTQPLVALLQRFPTGFTTQVQSHISQLVLTDLLHKNNPERSLQYCIVAELQQLYEQHEHTELDTARFHALAEPIIEEALTQYRVTRTASADITNTLSCTVLGAFAFQKFTPGGIGIALILTSIVSTKLAAQDFVFGETLGELYYEMFPPEPTLALTLSVSAGVLATLAAFAALSGILSDPIQATLGLHRYRLQKMLNHMEQDFLERSGNSFRPKDQYVARILETFDLIKTGLL
ncbi:hypothetical protein QKW35_05020 [Pontibacterium granulatum]|uniref:DUF6635 family protein n=1 Tax=Pontibacterium granulatum TaxID=2036029 RepID=UPI00249BDA9B|nr:DUF6635 family protein [Pontibacterium granulatum]MDI3323735.1 hypothetical protein [Pontibacterium granulatum]